MLSPLGTPLQPPVLYPLPADRAAAFALPGGEGQPGLVAGCGWLCFMPCFQPPADVSPGSSSSSPCSELGDQHTRLCCTAGETEARGSDVVCSHSKPAAEPRSRHSGPDLRLCHPPVWCWGRCPWCLPSPVSLGRGWAGGPMPVARQLGCPRARLGCPALPGSCHTP